MKKRTALWVGLATYSCLLLLAVLFFKERTIILDSAYHLFHIIDHRSFAIQGNRFGAVLTQVYPLAAVKMNSSLSAIALMYSLSFVIFFSIQFLLTLLWAKNTPMALCMLLFSVLMVTHTFYWPHPELPSGIVFTLFYLAWVDRFLLADIKSGIFLLSVPLFIVTIAFFHPLLIFVFFFANAYFFLLYRHRAGRKGTLFLAVTAAGYILILLFKVLFFRSAYESGTMSGLKNIITLFPNYFNTVTNRNMQGYFLHDYYFVPILLCITVLFYILRKDWYKLLLLLVFFFGFCFMVSLNYAGGTSQFYLEAQCLPLSLFVIIPFVYELLPAIKKASFAVAVVSFIAAIGIWRIWNAHDLYSDRVNWYRTFLARTSKLEQKKLILSPGDIPSSTLMMTWGSSFECWLLSTLEQGTSRSVIIEEEKGEFDWLMNNNKALITKWMSFEYKKMNKKYFVFNDTTYYTHGEAISHTGYTNPGQ